VLYRDQRSRVSVSGNLTQKDAQNYLAGVYLDVSSRRLSVLDLGVTASTNLLGGVVSLDLGMSRGLKLGDALVDPENLPDWAPRAQFSKVTFGASYFRPIKLFDTDLMFTSQMTGQRSRHTLYGSEQISVGGIYSVRGFTRNTLSGDKGYYIRNELSVRPRMEIAGQVFTPRVYLALDTGTVRGRVPGNFEGSLTGMALGVSASWKAASMDIFYASPISFPKFFTREAPQVWMRVSFSI
jgi:hemolysin activation/secretion protein